MKKSLVLLVITLLVVAYVYYFEVRPETKIRSTDEKDQVSTTLVGAKKEDIKSFTLHKTDSEAIAVELVNGEWVMTKPVAASAAEAAVNSVLWALEWTEKQDVIQPGELSAEKLASYGLDKPVGTVDVTLKDKSLHLIVGGKNLAQSSIYVRIGDDGPVALVAGSFADSLDTTAYDMRSKTVMPLVAAQTTYIKLSGRTDASLEKVDDRWNLLEPYVDYADGANVNKLIKDAGALTIKAFVSEDPQDFAQYGLDSPASSFTMAEGKVGGKRYTVNVGKDADPDAEGNPTVYACLSGGNSVFTLSAQQVAQVFAPIDQLQSKSIARFDPFALKSVTLNYGLGEIALSKPDFEWLVTKPFEARADATAVSLILSTFQKAKINNLVTADPTAGEYGFRTPSGSFSFLEAGHSTVAIVFGGDAGEGMVYAKRTDTPAIFRVSREILEALNQPAIDFHTREMQEVASTDLAAITITRGDEKYVVEPETGNYGQVGWRMTAPVKAPANEFMMTPIALALATTTAEELVEENPQDLSKYGLDKPAVRMEFAPKEGKVQPSPLLVGGKATAGKRYAMLEGDHLVFTIASSLARTLFEEVRDTRVFAFTAGGVSRVEVTAGEKKVVCNKNGDDWSVESPAGGKAVAAALESEFAQLSGLRTQKFVSYKTAELNKYGLDKPVAVVRLVLPTGIAALSVGNLDATGYRYVTSTTVEGVFLLLESDLSNVMSPDNLLEPQAGPAE